MLDGYDHEMSDLAEHGGNLTCLLVGIDFEKQAGKDKKDAESAAPLQIEGCTDAFVDRKQHQYDTVEKLDVELSFKVPDEAFAHALAVPCQDGESRGHEYGIHDRSAVSVYE